MPDLVSQVISEIFSGEISTVVSPQESQKPDLSNLAKYIDHTILKPDATEPQVTKICEEAKEYKFASVCVNPFWVKHSANLLKGTGVDVCTVIGFPLGASSTASKMDETKQAIADGATEIDMVINIGALKSQNYQMVLEDIKGVVKAANGTLVKVIIETCLLTDEEKIQACILSAEAKADYVKTSTGFSTGGALEEDILLMRKIVGPKIGVKASGGVRTREDAIKMINAGATRIGASAGIKIVSS
ncbi:MAG: deoxyribose-phosphate aldolase [Calditrichaeota bacterium]|nr:MAG: deoxyribose-phosphate aldolase [Calditrichota bacterium]